MQEKFIKMVGENGYFYDEVSPSGEKQLFTIEASKIRFKSKNVYNTPNVK